MKSLIEVFRMEEVSKETRVKIIIKLGRAINDQYGANITEGIVFELVSILDPENPILKDERYSKAK
ncbi:hypothetical protein E2605_07605 [Dysgonomonas capnocytophagoides]|uniref:Uncharacterized protein n=1 Tax=Dysgonomonas capnocytophagoides TaxID=45254 RepID=A0A4Y8L845_9BACT|nr:hypothetical protein [Dysgonomonas capnocytophagoides]TFD96676.1 hypothetical protein E2605_07605 [Dysgonomonas capnocytophagoides]